MGKAKGAKVDLKLHKIPLSVDQKMKKEIEDGAKDLGLSEQGFVRLCVRLYIKSGGIKKENLVLLSP